MKSKSHVIIDKEQVYQGYNKRHTDLTNKINDSQKVQDELDEKAKIINGQWESKRIQITHDVGTIRKLNEKISHVKLERRERLKKENEQAQNINVEVNHQTNHNINVLRN